MSNNDSFWNDEKVLEFAKEYRFSSSRICIDLFKEKYTPTVKEKDYEILAFNHNGIIIKKDIEDGWYVGGHMAYKIERLLKESYPIESVRRLSDNFIITKGDTVNSTWGEQVVTQFIIADDNTIVVEFATCRNPLSKIKEVKKPILTRQPLGIIPLWYHNEKRLEALSAAIERYFEANVSVPKEWIEERDNLIKYIQNRNA